MERVKTINFLQGVKAFRQPSKKQKRKPEDITVASILAVRAKHGTPLPFCPEEAPDEGAQGKGGPCVLTELNSQPAPTYIQLQE